MLFHTKGALFPITQILMSARAQRCAVSTVRSAGGGKGVEGLLEAGQSGETGERREMGQGQLDEVEGK